MLRYQIIPVTPLQQNCTVFWSPKTNRGGIVDPGGDLSLIRNFLSENDITLEMILCTHGHLDHVGAVSELANELSLPIIGPHKDDLFWIEGLLLNMILVGVPLQLHVCSSSSKARTKNLYGLKACNSNPLYFYP